MTTRRPCTKTVASWRSWVRDTAYYVDDEVVCTQGSTKRIADMKARPQLEKNVPGVAKVLDGWNRTARADFVLACADQHWCTTDSVEINNGRIAWDDYAAIVESYQPGEVEKSRLYSITTFDPATFTSTCQFVTWDGREVPDLTAMPALSRDGEAKTPRGRRGSGVGGPRSVSLWSEGSVSPRSPRSPQSPVDRDPARPRLPSPATVTDAGDCDVGVVAVELESKPPVA